MKKTTLLLIVLYFLFLSENMLKAQSPEYLWANRAGAVGYEYAYDVAIDPWGNTYITGNFAFDITFEPGRFIHSSGGSDFYLVKYNPNGKLIWAKPYGSNRTENASTLAIDSLGQVYVAGNFNGGNLILGTDTLKYVTGGVNSNDVFIAKFDTAGNVIWARSAGGTADDRALAIAVGHNGSPVITGYFVSPTITFGTITHTHSGDQDMFITKYDTEGNVVWSKMGVGTGREWAYSIAIDLFDNCYVSGCSNGMTLVFGTKTLTKKGGNDVYLVKYSPAGKALWATNAGVSGENSGRSVATDYAGNVYLAGEYSGTSIVFGDFTLPNSGYKDIFVVKFDSAGVPLWANYSGGTKEDAAYAVDVDKFGYCYVAGLFKSQSITIGSKTLTNFTDGTSDIFVAEYSPSGANVWAKSMGGKSNDQPSSIVVDKDRNFYMCGQFSGDSVLFDTKKLVNAGTIDIFCVKSDNTPVQAPNAVEYTTINIPVYPNPAQNEVIIEAPANALIEIVNIQGQVCEQFMSTLDETRLNIGELPAGIYFIKISTGKEYGVVKLLKQ